MIAKFHAATLAVNVIINFQAPSKHHLDQARQLKIQAVDSNFAKVFALALILLGALISRHQLPVNFVVSTTKGIFLAPDQVFIKIYITVANATVQFQVY